ncbi:glycosyltransferase [Photobacterium profundum]|uniref:glycosyltransferase family 2 protein n=1 Tax=Photobacterium profundum TaxID=74109 RepID=UPI003D0CD996
MIRGYPQVTICITTYNRKDKLLSCIDSVLKQQFQDFEIVVVDDFSSDGTDNINFDNVSDKVKYIRHSENLGLASARNTAINIARGKYFTFVDDDDSWSELFLEEMLKQVNPNDKKTIYCSQCLGVEVFTITASLKQMMIDGFTPPVAAQLYLTKELKDIGGYDTRIKSGVDHDLWFKFATQSYNIKWLNQSLVIQNVIESNDRMTCNYTHRLLNIEESIFIWKARMEGIFPDDFWFFLWENYKYNSIMKEVRRKVRVRDFSGLPLLLCKLPYRVFYRDALRRFIKRFFDNSIGLQGYFFKYKG